MHGRLTLCSSYYLLSNHRMMTAVVMAQKCVLKNRQPQPIQNETFCVKGLYSSEWVRPQVGFFVWDNMAGLLERWRGQNPKQKEELCGHWEKNAIHEPINERAFERTNLLTSWSETFNLQDWGAGGSMARLSCQYVITAAVRQETLVRCGWGEESNSV